MTTNGGICRGGGQRSTTPRYVVALFLMCVERIEHQDIECGFFEYV